MEAPSTLFEDLERICRELRSVGTSITFIHHENLERLKRYLVNHGWRASVIKENGETDIVELSKAKDNQQQADLTETQTV